MDEAAAVEYSENLSVKIQELTDIFGVAMNNGHMGSPFEDLMVFLQMRLALDLADAEAAFARYVVEQPELPKIIQEGSSEELFNACTELLTTWGYSPATPY